MIRCATFAALALMLAAACASHHDDARPPPTRDAALVARPPDAREIDDDIPCTHDDDCRLTLSMCGYLGVSTADTAQQDADQAAAMAPAANCKRPPPVVPSRAACVDGGCRAVPFPDPAAHACTGDADCGAGGSCVERACLIGFVRPTPRPTKPPPPTTPASRTRRSGPSSR